PYGADEPRVVTEGATPLVGCDLTTHRGHFMGNGHNRLVLYTHEGRAWVHAAGTWDPMPWRLGRAYRRAGSAAQHACCAPGDGERWAALVAPLLDGFDAVRATMIGGFPPVAGAWRLLTDAGPAATLRLAGVLPAPARLLARRLFRSGGARAWLYGAAMH